MQTLVIIEKREGGNLQEGKPFLVPALHNVTNVRELTNDLESAGFPLNKKTTKTLQNTSQAKASDVNGWRGRVQDHRPENVASIVATLLKKCEVRPATNEEQKEFEKAGGTGAKHAYA